jgi:hypothetical protein
MPIQTPPAIVAPAPLPSHVHAELKEAERAVEAVRPGERHVLAYISGTADQARMAMDWAATMAGAEKRGDYEIWIAAPADPEGQSILDHFKLRSSPALLELKVDGKDLTLVHSRFGPDAENPIQAFKEIEDPSPGEIASDAAALCKEHPELGDTAMLLKFREARKASLSTASSEPYRTWLAGILKTSQNKDVKAWAATRLAEANAAIAPGDTSPLPVVAEYASERMFSTLRPDLPNGKLAIPVGQSGTPFLPFGDLAEIPDDAPFWPAFRKALQAKHLTPSLPIYALMSPHLKLEDRAWLLDQVTKGSTKSDGAQDSVTSWMSLDWLLVYGEPQDWEAFLSASQSSAWKGVFSQEMREVQDIQAYWGVSRRVQDMFCEGVTEEEFWKNPETCLAEWGVTRQSLVDLAWDQGRIKKQARILAYPVEAKRRRLVNSVHLRLVIDPTGKVRSIRPEPGYALAFFAPAAMGWASKTVFVPTMIAGVPRPGKFVYHMNFRLN